MNVLDYMLYEYSIGWAISVCGMCKEFHFMENIWCFASSYKRFLFYGENVILSQA